MLGNAVILIKGVNKALRCCTNVDLPLPVLPINAAKALSGMVKETPSTATFCSGVFGK